MQDFWMLLKLDNTSWRKTLQNFHNFMQWSVVDTLFQEKKKHHNQKDGSKGTPRLGPYWKLQLVACKINMEWKLELNLWTKTILTLGSEFLMDQISLWWIWTTMKQKFQKISSKNKRYYWMQKISHSPLGKGIGLTLNQGNKHSFSDFEVSKKVTYLLRHSQQVHREEDGAVHFWRIKENLRDQLSQSIHWFDDKWKACLAAGVGAKRRFQYCTDDSGTIVYFRALQGHSERNLFDPSLQDNVLIQSNLFQKICHVGCAFNFAFYHQFWINIWRSKFEQETDSVLLACWSCGQKSQGS